ncbi:MAG: Sapep family Mn(2+)-dependent dipeptidase [Oscillospiraceae bacterium]|nr:Sapep family Mn(2+)-dependent dipeptidase [Oscillospiraceae bacterium]
MDLDRLDGWFAQKEEEMVQAVGRLVAIKSVKEAPQPGKPYGPGPAAALSEGLKLAEELGFSIRNYDNQAGTVLLNDRPLKLDILAHLDVVGEGTGWNTPPYQAVLKDGMLFGRGTDDDKGPVVASLYAMLAVRETGIPLRYNTRLILGTNEESGFADLEYFFAREPHAEYTFSPDGSFPVINIEKGMYRPAFTGKFRTSPELPRICALNGGYRINVVPPEAWAVVEGISKKEAEAACKAAEQETGAAFAVSDEDGDRLRITAHGTGAHASRPQEGNNALTALLHLLCTMPMSESQGMCALRGLHDLFPHGDSAGKAAGIAMEEPKSGKLTLALSLLHYEPSGLTGRFDSRTPLCATEENCAAVMTERLSALGLSVSGQMERPHHTPEDSPFVQTLLRCYEACTGDKGKCLALGGGTYVHDVEGGVAFGGSMPGFQSNLHSANEHISIRDFMLSAKIYARAILALCQ